MTKNAFKRICLTSAFWILGGSFCLADQVASGKFKGLNSNENSTIIGPSFAQDLADVDVTPGGLSVKKRFGYGVYKALGTGQAVHAGYHFYDSTGNDVQIVGSSTSLYGIVADGTPTQLISSNTLNSTWDCADTQGSAYCVNSNRDAFVKTNGVTKLWSATPAGTMVEATPDRIVVAGVAASPNTLFVSQSNTFTNFTVGNNATDPFNEVIASPGSKLTHIRWGCGKLLFWKDQSFGYFDFDDQFAAQVKTVSDTIGTLDNTSAIDPGGRVWFRGQDGHTWMYDCSILTKQSIEITPNVQSSGRRVSNFWTQTSQSDFAAGASSQVVTLSTTVSPGDVTVGTFTATDSFSTGGLTNLQVTGTTLIISTNAAEVSNNSFETGSVTNWTLTQSGSSGSSFTQSSADAEDGTKSLLLNAPGDGVLSNTFEISVSILDKDGNNLEDATFSSGSQFTSSWNQNTWTFSNYARKRIKIKVSIDKKACTGGSCTSGQSGTATSDSFISNGKTSITLWLKSPDIHNAYIDNFGGTPLSSIAGGSFVSQVFDTGLAYSTIITSVSWTASTFTPSFVLQKGSSTTGGWNDVGTSTGTNYGTNKRYARYLSTFTVSATDNALSTLNSVTLIAASSGTYYSAIKNAPNISGWSTLNVNTQLNNGTETFYVRACTDVLTNVLQSTPAWTAQSAGSLITIATGTYIQFRDDFAVTAATQIPALNDFTVNWFEGSAGDQAYMVYFDNAIWESVASGSGQSTNNRIFKYDLINEGWTIYTFGANGLWIQSNTLYFGDTSAGNVFNYGTVKSDNGTAISAYWKTKDFTGQDPFLQNALTNIDTFTKKDQGTTLTSAYTLDTSTTSTSYSINLSSTTSSVIQSRKLLPPGKNGYTFNLKYSDSSVSSQWELFGYRIGFSQLPYRSAN